MKLVIFQELPTKHNAALPTGIAIVALMTFGFTHSIRIIKLLPKFQPFLCI
jgi:hypothetical protein